MNHDEITKTWTDKSRILIVDNNAQFANRVRLLLEATGNYSVVPRPTHGFDLIKVVEENLPCCASA